MEHRRSFRIHRVENLERRNLLAADVWQEILGPALEQTVVISAALEPELEEQLTPDSTEVVKLALPSYLPTHFTTTFDYGGHTLTLQLEKNSVFGENTKFLIDDGTGTLVEFDPGVERAYLGTVVGYPGVAVSAVLTDSGLEANIIRPNGPSIVIAPSVTVPGMHEVSLGEEGLGQAAALSHDHDGDGIPDHDPENHDDESGGGHPPGCTCGACCLIGKDETVAASTGETSNDLPLLGNPSTIEDFPELPRPLATLPTGRVIDVREYEIGVEIGSAALLNNYTGATTQDKIDHAMSVAQGVPGNLDARFLHAAGIKHKLGTVIIRTGSDPFTVSNGNDSAGLAAFRDYWNNLQTNEGIAPTHDLAVYHVRSGPSGLAYVNSVGTSNRYALSASNGPTSWADGTLAHEFGHSWNLGHVPSGTDSSANFYEARPRSNANTSGGNDYFISIMHGGGNHNTGRLSTGEAERVLDAKSSKLSFGDPVSPGPVDPFGWADSATTFDTPVTIDVIANDHDANNDVLDAQLRDTVSYLGGTISISSESGPGGRNEIIYTPPVGVTGSDFFHYTVVDSTGRTDWGAVHVTVADPAINVNLNADDYNYDLGTPGSPVLTGGSPEWVRISPNTTGGVWWSDSVSSVDRGSIPGVNDAHRDLVYSSATRTLNHKISNGIWDVTLQMGDADFAHDNMQVSAEGITLDSDVDSAVGEFTYVVFQITVTDGELNIEFSDNGGSSPVWVVTRLSLSLVTPLPNIPGDFNVDDQVDEDDLSAWESSYGVNGDAGGDADFDGRTNGLDFLIWQRNFGVGIPTTLIDANTGNGSFEDLSGGVGAPEQTNANRVAAVLDNPGITDTDTATIPGWTSVVDRYLDGSAGNVFAGFDTNASRSSDGIRYAFANKRSRATLTSDPLTQHTTQTGDEFTLQFDTGSLNSEDADYIVRLIFGAEVRELGTFTEMANGTGSVAAYTQDREYTYTANAADAGAHPVVEIVINNGPNTNNEQWYVDDVRFSVMSTSTALSASAAAVSSLSVEQEAESASAKVLPSREEFGTAVSGVETSDLSVEQPAETAQLASESVQLQSVALTKRFFVTAADLQDRRYSKDIKNQPIHQDTPKFQAYDEYFRQVNDSSEELTSVSSWRDLSEAIESVPERPTHINGESVDGLLEEMSQDKEIVVEVL